MDRLHLSEWSLGVDDERFVAALAALGVLETLARDVAADASSAEVRQRVAEVSSASAGATASALAELLRAIAARTSTHATLAWQAPEDSPARARPPAGLQRWPSAASLAEAWKTFAATVSPIRVAASDRSAREGLSLDFVELLSRGEAQLAGVHAVASWEPERPTEWRFPFTIATLPGDRLGDALVATRGDDASASSEARVVVASRRTPHVEVLVLGQPLPRALARVLEATPVPRCALAIVRGPGSDSPSRCAPLLRALAAHLQADGVVVAPTLALDAFADALRRFAGRMANGYPLDVALMQSMGPGHVAWLGTELLALSERVPARQAAAKPRAAASRAEPPHAAPPPPRTAGASRPVGSRPPWSLPTTRAPAPGQRNSNLPDSRPRWRPSAPSGPQRPIPAPVPAPSPAPGRLGTPSWWRWPPGRPAFPAPTPPPASAPADDARRPRPDVDGHPARYLQQRSLRKRGDELERIRDGYVLAEPVMLCVRVAAPDDAGWDSAPTPFPEHELPKDRDTHVLQVVVHEPGQFDGPVLREIVLPRVGPSSEAQFVFTPRKEGVFDARISVLHRGRVLQTARLRTRVRQHADERGDGIALLDEAQVRPDLSGLGARRRFDLAMVLNHGDADDVPRLTAIAERRAWATNLQGLAEPLLQLNAALSDAAHSVADHADGLDQGENPQLLVRLARIGADLYSALCMDQFIELSHGGFDPRDDALTHIQVISARADAVVPVEFFYDYPPPAPDATKLCPGWRDALKTGNCPADCAGRADASGHVCPMGFWGLRKVIERHVYSPALGRPDGAEVVIQSEPAEGRDRLELGHCAVLGFSTQVAKDARTPLLALLSPRFEDATLEVATWTEWKETIGQRKPALLVAFPHNEGRRQDLELEIGGDFLPTLRLPREYVRPEGAPPPLVFLLGCDVAGTAEAFSNHIRYFRQAGAAAVISTTATVFGEHAVTVGSKILARLLRAGGAEADQLGELILDARREAMLESLPMALCIVAFGDADWRL